MKQNFFLPALPIKNFSSRKGKHGILFGVTEQTVQTI